MWVHFTILISLYCYYFKKQKSIRSKDHLVSLNSGSGHWSEQMYTALQEGALQKAIGMTRGVELVFLEEKLQELGLFSVEKGRLRGILSMCINAW